MSFQSLGLSAPLLQVLQELGYSKPTPIQEQAIPSILQGRDVIAQAKTGSGKTGAFGIPLIEKLELGERRKLQALVLAPTRELCAQVARELRKMGRRISGLQVLPVSGGTPIFPQVAALEKGVHIVVGTPGRIIDHLERGTLDLRGIRFLILDEADRMLDMGFEEDMERILRDCPAQRQTTLFSATYPATIEAISRRYQKNPHTITVSEEDTIPATIQQVLIEVSTEQEKPAAITQVLAAYPSASTVIFCNLKASTITLARDLRGAGLSAEAIHGDLEQYDRDRVLAKFRNGSTRILIATDVAARGLDVENLGLVIHCDVPVSPDVYVHRTGRTGRAGKSGTSILLATSKQSFKVKAIEAQTQIPLLRQNLPEATPAKRESAEGATPINSTAAMETIQINGGRKQKVRPGDILGALTGETGKLQGSDVGKIEIHDFFAYVAVRKEVADLAMRRINDGTLKGRRFKARIVR